MPGRQLREALQRRRRLGNIAQREQPADRGGVDGAGAGEMSDEFGSMGAGEGEEGIGDEPGGSGAGSGQGSGDEAIYDPLLSSSSPDFVPGQTPFDPNETYQNPDLDSPYGNEAQVGYKQVFAQYQEKATQSLQNSYIPAGLKDIVKDYFSSLAPNK